MQKTFEIRGLPDAMARDAWWFGDGADGEADRKDRSDAGLSGRRRIAAVAVLVLVADVLFWHQRVGASLAVFALAVFAVATFDLSGQRRLVWPALVAVAGALPVVAMVQPLSVAFLILSQLVAVVWARCPAASSRTIAASVLWLA